MLSECIPKRPSHRTAESSASMLREHRESLRPEPSQWCFGMQHIAALSAVVIVLLAMPWPALSLPLIGLLIHKPQSRISGCKPCVSTSEQYRMSVSPASLLCLPRPLARGLANPVDSLTTYLNCRPVKWATSRDDERACRMRPVQACWSQ